MHIWAMPMSMLASEGYPYLGELLSKGLEIEPGRMARQKLTVYIQSSRPTARGLCTPHVGWHHDCFVLPSKTIGTSAKKFGKCPIQYILEGDQEKPRTFIILNPNEQWCQSPVEALQCALTRITGTDDNDLAKEIIDRAISAMPMANGKEHNTNVVY